MKGKKAVQTYLAPRDSARLGEASVWLARSKDEIMREAVTQWLDAHAAAVEAARVSGAPTELARGQEP